MKLSVLLVAAGCLLSAVSAQRLETTTPLPDSSCGVFALPAGPFVAGEAIVRFVPSAAPVSNLQTAALLARWNVSGLKPLLSTPNELACRFGLDRQYLLTFPAATHVAAVLADLSASPLVEYACPNALLELDSIPSDSFYPQQWHLEHIGAPYAWQIAHGDSAVKLAVVATGVHWTHPDIEANLWVNAAEDINHNGRFDPQPAGQGGDVDGVDQDGNGRADDVIGYDFLDVDPNPFPSEQQAAGTHGAGVLNAVTDNSIGVSAPPWNVRSVVVRCGSHGSISMSAAIAAIAYLVDIGADALSLPFGSSTPYPPLADVCLYAWESGVILCAPAGTDGQEVVRYPAGHEGVIAVAAHGKDNRKSPFSNYGAWIDVTAPGVDIWSTQGDSGYIAWDGTGPACSVVAGILGWLESAYPGISRDSVVSILKNTCDTMPDPLYRQGKLGAGRVRMSTPVTGIAEPVPGTPGELLFVPAIVRGVLHMSPQLSASSLQRAELLDISGRNVMTLKSGPNDVSHLAPGVYFVTVDGARNSVHVRKMVVAE